jgi:hypothetical protein
MAYLDPRTNTDRIQPLIPPYEPPGRLRIVSLRDTADNVKEKDRSSVRSRFKLKSEILSSEPRPEFVPDAFGDMPGLTHCLDRNCAIYPSNSLVQSHMESTVLYPICRSGFPP